MKTKIRSGLIIRPSVATVMALSIAITQSLHISLGSVASAPSATTRPSATQGPDDVDGVVQAAKDGITSLNASNSARVKEVSSALNTFAAAVGGLKNDLAALNAEIVALLEKIRALNEQIEALQNQMESLGERSAELNAKVEALEQCTPIKQRVAEEYGKLIKQLQIRIAEAEAKNQSTASLKQELSTLQSKRDEELRKLQTSCAAVLSETEKLRDQVEQTAKVRKILAKLSVDRTKASQLVQLIRTNNRTGLSEFLRLEAGGGDFVISDAKIISGPLVVFRVDSISHCLSAGSQCSGKSYLLTR